MIEDNDDVSLGFQALERNDYHQAVFLFSSAYRDDPNRTEALRGLAWTQYCQGCYFEALQMYIEYIQKAPADFAAHEGAALTYYALGKKDDAIREMKTAATIESSNPEPHIILSSFYRGLKEYDAAQDSLREAITLKPASVDIYLEKGTLEKEQGNYAQALRFYHVAAELDPDNFEVSYRIGRLQLDSHDYSGAHLSFLTTLKLHPQWPDALYGLALAEVGLRHISSATETLETLIHIKPGFQLAYVQLARLYLKSFQIGKYYKTIKRGIAFSVKDGEYSA